VLIQLHRLVSLVKHFVIEVSFVQPCFLPLYFLFHQMFLALFLYKRFYSDWLMNKRLWYALCWLKPDYAYQVYCLQTEALLKLQRHQEAYATFEKMPKFDLDSCKKIFGPARTAYLMMIAAQIYLAAGRFVKVLYFDDVYPIIQSWFLYFTLYVSKTHQFFFFLKKDL